MFKRKNIWHGTLFGQTFQFMQCIIYLILTYLFLHTTTSFKNIVNAILHDTLCFDRSSNSWNALLHLILTYIFLQTTTSFKHIVNAIGNKQNIEWRRDPPLIVVDCCVPFIPPEFLWIQLYSRKRVAEIKTRVTQFIF